ncbi:MAG: zinc ribbon domain-containing protein [Chloroflexi bacterium]|nr:zinc ribbon domain-containing protein [Chloroflexota bacterium]
MPLYEYVCRDCGAGFEELRTMSQADTPIGCPKCSGMNARRKVSLFAAIGSNGPVAGSGTGCASCSSGSCATCASRGAPTH